MSTVARVGSLAATRGGIALPSSRARARTRRGGVRVRAPVPRAASRGGDDGEENSGKKRERERGERGERGDAETDGVDWKGVFGDSIDEAKRQFMEPLGSPSDYVDMMDVPRRRKDERSKKNAEEYGALDPWSSNAFTTYGLISVAVLLFVFVVIIGPPPDTNGRCSLPWC